MPPNPKPWPPLAPKLKVPDPPLYDILDGLTLILSTRSQLDAEYLVIVIVEAERSAHAKVADLGMLFAGQQNIAGGQIAMYELHGLEVVHTESNLIHKSCYSFHRQPAQQHLATLETTCHIIYVTNTMLQVAQLAERPRDESAILRRWVTLRLHFRLKGYVSRQYLWTLYMEEWLYYNSAAGSFHRKKLRSRLYSIEIEFYSKIFLKSPFEPHHL